jgi:RimJ/RimL family protein N-acetyltransferase
MEALAPVKHLDIPIIETERLLLRGYREEDFEPFAAILADPEVGRFIAGATTRAEAWRRFADVLGHWALRGHGFWAVERKSDGAFIGRIGLNRPESWPGLEVGWTLGSAYWGKGYATEAARAALDFGFRNYPEGRLISLIDPANTPSQKVASRLGMRRGPAWDLGFEGRTFTVDVWEIGRESWAARSRPAYA